ncbi:uncharacterized protein JCM15063_004794 [Sporobolomyces koalae]|uniref:uncharacterized protein n=1 Tax=Sporobolomyces koalae TaxID=500713 RepID=UPI003179DE05
MSTWADIAAKNAPPEELQAHPDPRLLERKEDHPTHEGEQAVDYEAEHVHVVDRDEADKLRKAMDNAEDSQAEDEFARARRHQEERDAATQQARLKAQTQQELKKEVDVVEAEASSQVEQGKATAEKTAKDADKVVKDTKQEVNKTYNSAKEQGKEALAEGKKEAKEKYAEGKKVAGEKWEQGKKEAKEFADKAEKEVKKDAKKVQKKAGEIEKEGRALAREYPYAATGLVGAVNLALVAVPAYYAYQNWNKPRWDRRIISAFVVGLTAAFGAESALGWFEYKEGHRPNL